MHSMSPKTKPCISNQKGICIIASFGQLWESKPIIYTSLVYMTQSSLVNYDPHKEPLEGIIFGTALAAVGVGDGNKHQP